MINEISIKIDKLSCVLNTMIAKDLIKSNYNEVLKVSQELDKLILVYTKLKLS